ncbi:MAG: hypothetical protein E7218_05260 [Anaerofustis stercorihominis]|nr:hypothetical protein [Anaerofustis stercorihominis]
MKKYFIASLCKNGIIGGGITADYESVTYHCGKITLPEKYRKLQMRYENILSAETGRLFILPAVTMKMNNGEEYKFVIFARRRFMDILRDMGVIT